MENENNTNFVNEETVVSEPKLNSEEETIAENTLETSESESNSAIQEEVNTEVFDNEVLNKLNSLVSERNYDKYRLDQIKIEINKIQEEIKVLQKKIDELSIDKSYYNTTYVSKLISIALSKYRLYKVSHYAGKMAKLNVKADLLLITKNGQKINATKYLSNKKNKTEDLKSVVVDGDLNSRIKNYTTFNIEKSVNSASELQNNIVEDKAIRQDSKEKAKETKDKLENLRKEQKAKRKILLGLTKEYCLLYKKYASSSKTLKNVVNNELSIEKKIRFK